MPEYKISYHGYCYVTADSREEAEEAFDDDEEYFDHLIIDSIVEE